MADYESTYSIDVSAARAALTSVLNLSRSVAQQAKGALGGVSGRNAKGQFTAVGDSATGAGKQITNAESRAARFFAVMRRASRVALGVGAIGVALVALNRKFPVIGQTARKTFRQVHSSAGSGLKSIASFTAKLIKHTPAAAGAAIAVFNLVKAYRALRGAAPGKLPAMPKPGRSSRGGMGMGKMLGPLALAGGLFLGGSAIKDQIASAMQGAAAMEQTEVTFEVLTGGLAPAKKALDDIRALAENTPLKFTDVAGAGRSLLAFQEPAQTLQTTLKRIGDISQGVQAPIGEIAELYGKARVQGTLFAEDLNQLTGRGIPILTEFASILGTTPDKIKKMASEGQITFPLLEKAFANLTGQGGAFEGMMAKLAKTVGGLWSTLTDRIEMAWQAFAKPINDSLKPALEYAIERAGELKAQAAGFGEKIAQAVDFVTALFQTMSGGEIFAVAGKALQLGFQQAVDVLWKGVSAVINAFKNEDFMAGVRDSFTKIADPIKNAIIDGVQASMRAMSGMKLIGDDFAAAADSIDVQREIEGYQDRIIGVQKKSAAEGRRTPGEVLAEYYDRSAGLFGETGNANVAAELAEMLKGVRGRADELFAARTGSGADASAVAAKPEGLIPETKIASAATAGVFQQAKNLALGKTVNELVASEAQKSNQLLDAIKKSNDRVERSSAETARNTSKKPEVKVSVVPTFGSAGLA